MTNFLDLVAGVGFLKKVWKVTNFVDLVAGVGFLLKLY
jgi:hypothetical protein